MTSSQIFDEDSVTGVDVGSGSGSRASVSSRAPWAEGLRLFLPLTVLVVTVSLLASAVGPSTERIALAALLDLIMVLGLYCFSGTSGVMSFGQVGFGLMGAYISGILAMAPAQRELLLPDLPSGLTSLDPSVAVLPVLAALLCALVAVPIGIVIVRLDGVVASIGTFAVLVIVHEGASNLRSLNGPAGVSGVPVSTTLGGALAWTVVALAITCLFRFSRTGLMLRASSGDPYAAAAAGVDIRRARLVGYIVSASLFGTAGAVYAQFVGSFTPDTFYLTLTTLLIAMLVVGGTQSVSGAVVGCLAVTVVYQLLQHIEAGISIGSLEITGVTGLAEMGLAAALLLTLIVRPAGLTNGAEWGVERLLGRRRGTAAMMSHGDER